MKRVSLLAAILMTALIGLVPASATGETSFFDGSTNSIIRAYTSPGSGAGVWDIHIAAVGTNGSLLPSPTSFSCTGGGSGNPAVAATDCGDEYGVSMAFDASQGNAYIFYPSSPTQAEKLVTCTRSGGTPPPPAGGSPDLTTTWTYTCPPGWSSGSCIANNVTFTMTVTVKNQGTGNAGPFTVKGFINKADTTTAPTFGGTTLFSWDLSGLAAGASQTQSFQVKFIEAIHYYYWFGVMVDTANTVAESNETNNIKAIKYLLTR